jgi:hypothetical protein
VLTPRLRTRFRVTTKPREDFDMANKGVVKVLEGRQARRFTVGARRASIVVRECDRSGISNSLVSKRTVFWA